MPTEKTGILLVDDEVSEIEAVTRALQASKQFKVFSALSYTEALDVYERNKKRIQLAVLDVSLPEKNGVELAKQLLLENEDLRILFISGHVGASVIRFYGMNASDEHFLQKPYSDEIILSRVQQALRGQEPLRQTLSARDSSIQE